MKIGVIQDTTLKGRKIILEPREGVPDNLWLVEEGRFLNGSSQYTMYCLVCEKRVPSLCPECNKEKV